MAWLMLSGKARITKVVIHWIVQSINEASCRSRMLQPTRSALSPLAPLIQETKGSISHALKSIRTQERCGCDKLSLRRGLGKSADERCSDRFYARRRRQY